MKIEEMVVVIFCSSDHCGGGCYGDGNYEIVVAVAMIVDWWRWRSW